MAPYLLRMWNTYERRREMAWGKLVWVHGVCIEHAACDWNGERFEVAAKKGGALGPLARSLVSSQASDGPWVGIDAIDGRTRLEGKSLHRLSRLTVKDGRGGPRFAEWHPHPLATEAVEP